MNLAPGSLSYILCLLCSVNDSVGSNPKSHSENLLRTQRVKHGHSQLGTDHRWAWFRQHAAHPLTTLRSPLGTVSRPLTPQHLLSLFYFMLLENSTCGSLTTPFPGVKDDLIIYFHNSLIAKCLPSLFLLFHCIRSKLGVWFPGKIYLGILCGNVTNTATALWILCPWHSPDVCLLWVCSWKQGLSICAI